ncbi:MAG TPA: DegV family protein, partial [Nevskiaceae bacterium]|nr:DegV family protein [Nevskiaceae bacterium]
MRVGLVVDSACDLPADFIAANRIVVLPVTIHLGSSDLVDTRDEAQTRQFYETHLGSNPGAHTTALSVDQMKAVFLDRLVADYDYVFCLTIASGRSPIYE